MRLKAAPILAAAYFAFPLAGDAAPGTFERCYGETLEVVFPETAVGRNPRRMSLPSANASIIQLIDGTTLYEDSACQPEPLTIRRLTGALLNTSLGNDEADELSASGIYPRFFHLWTGAEHEAGERSRRLSMIEEDGVEMPGGLRIVNDKSGSGKWSLVRLPIDWLDPLGAQVVMACNFWRSCDLSYPLFADLSLRYEVLNTRDHEISELWVEIDKGVRQTLLSWFLSD
jgi:hypothetical protein